MKRFGLIGNNISYSLSPEIHQIIYDYLGIKCSYDIIDIGLSQFNDALQTIKKDFDGANITKPFKKTAYKAVDSVFCETEAVNTLIPQDNKLKGYNTDVTGFLRDFTYYFTDNSKNVLICGCGGAAEAVVWALLKYNFNVFVTARDLNKLNLFCSKFGVKSFNAGDYYDVVINCVSEKFYKTSWIDLIKNNKVLYDINYFDKETELNIKNNGADYIGGLGMLINQAIDSAELMLKVNFGLSDRKRLFILIKNRLR